MSPKLKICGITSLADARYCAGAGVDYLGFIQYEQSPRYIEPAAAKQIIDWLYGPTPVGVFVNADAHTINTAAETAGFAWIQLHGDETPDLCSDLDRPIIKAIRVQPGETADAVRRRMAPFAPHVEAFLLDTHHADQYGGTGERFDWSVAQALAADHRLFLAGGIDATNVADAIQTVRPYAVDLSSSVEERPGVKDFDKLADFFDAFAAATR